MVNINTDLKKEKKVGLSWVMQKSTLEREFYLQRLRDMQCLWYEKCTWLIMPEYVIQPKVSGDCSGVLTCLGSQNNKDSYDWSKLLARWAMSFFSNQRLWFYTVECSSWFSPGTTFPKFLGMVEYPLLESFGIFKKLIVLNIVQSLCYLH